MTDIHVPDRASSRAVLLGSSEYSSLPDLPSVAHNVADLRAALTDAERGVFSAEHCHEYDGREDERRLYKRLLDVAKGATDTFLFYFAGHGRPAIDIKGLFLALHDMEESLRFGALTLDDVRELFRASPAIRKVLILDCCFSGRGLVVEDLSCLHDMEVAGQFVVASAPADDVAYAPEGQRNTLFTGELLKILRDGIPNGPGQLTIREVTSHLSGVMRNRELRPPKTSQMGSLEGLVIARNPACPGGQLSGGGSVGWVDRTELNELVFHCLSLPVPLVFGLYQRVLEDSGVELGNQETVDSVIARLAQLPHQAHHELPRLLTFVIRAALETADADMAEVLEEWTDRIAGRLGLEWMVRHTRQKMVKETDREPLNSYLVVRIERNLLKRSRRYLARIVHHRGHGGAFPQPFDEDRTWSLSELKRELPKHIAESLRGVMRDRVTIEFVVPRELLHVDFDEWPWPSGGTLGYWYRVVVCDLEREDREVPKPEWVNKWNLLQKQTDLPPPENTLYWIDPAGTQDVDELRLALVNNRTWICVALAAAPARDQLRLMDVPVDLGGPAAIWPRESASATTSAIRDLLIGGRLAMLPDRVRELRRTATTANGEQLGRSLTLLWDDPARAGLPNANAPLVTPAQAHGGTPR